MTRTESGLALRPLASQARTLGTCCPKEQVAGEGPPAWVVAEGWGISRAPLTPGRTRRLPACGSCSCEIAAPGLLPPPQAPSPCWPHTCAHTLTAAPPCARPLTRWDAVMAGDTLDPRGTMTIRAGACTGAGAVPAPPGHRFPEGLGHRCSLPRGTARWHPVCPPRHRPQKVRAGRARRHHTLRSLKRWKWAPRPNARGPLRVSTRGRLLSGASQSPSRAGAHCGSPDGATGAAASNGGDQGVHSEWAVHAGECWGQARLAET